jgi:hypothetical protein
VQASRAQPDADAITDEHLEPIATTVQSMRPVNTSLIESVG